MTAVKERSDEKKKNNSKNNSFAVKTLVAVCGIALCLVCVFLLPLWGTAILVSAVNAMIYYELASAFGFFKCAALSVPGLITSCVYPWLFYFNAQPVMFALVFILGAAVSFLSLLLFSGENMARELMLSVVSFTVFPLMNSLNISVLSHDNGKLLIIIPYVCAWGADTFAQITGRIAGRHPLAPSISPNKTAEGFAGGIIGGTLLSFIASFVISKFAPAVDVGMCTAVSFAGTLTSSLGDLFFSYIKRSRGIKDFSNLMPGHGGILDRFDSVLFTLALFAVLFRGA